MDFNLAEKPIYSVKFYFANSFIRSLRKRVSHLMETVTNFLYDDDPIWKTTPSISTPTAYKPVCVDIGDVGVSYPQFAKLICNFLVPG